MPCLRAEEGVLKLVLASRNQKKIEEMRRLMAELLPGVEVLSLDDVGVTEDIVEDGDTFEANALIKARAAAVGGCIGVADDSGLTVDALGGEPGIWSARYAARCGVDSDHNDEANNQLVLKKLEAVPDAERGGAYVCAVACVLPSGESFTVRGEVRGRILREYHGTGGFGYDPMFYYPPFGKTFAELTAGEKDQVSHRGTAMRLFAAALRERLAESGAIG